MIVAVCVCVTFQSVHVVNENANASHTDGILVMVSYQVYGASNLATFKGVYGTVNAPHTHYRKCNLAKSECEHMLQTSRKITTYTVKGT